LFIVDQKKKRLGLFIHKTSTWAAQPSKKKNEKKRKKIPFEGVERKKKKSKQKRKQRRKKENLKNAIIY